jgi:hypothetical protein
MTTDNRRRGLVRAVAVALWLVVIVIGGWWAVGALRDRAETVRITARYDPPVMAGQMVTGACSGGFYARHDQTVVMTLSAHCLEPGVTLRDADGRFIGVLGPRAQLTDCPEGRFCSPSDFLTLALAADRIPWGHLNMVDLGAGGYVTFDASTRPLACGDLRVGGRVETEGLERYRTGTIVEVAPYEHEVDTIFPCMAAVNIQVSIGDSGAAVLVDGKPAGIIARQIGSAFGFTPLAEGLENLGLTLCTSPDCDLNPATAVQPAE